ncbi:MFS transporter permease [Glycomyces mayteni]|uniref:MFS transporter permease n=1 Tax=Glycomyces mayteni TaxID=543887 RepID=A0ABW2D562_9ACTN
MSVRSAVNGFFFEPVPLGRVAAMRFLAGLYVWIEWWAYMPFIFGHRFVPGELYQPLFVGRVLPLPTPDYWIVTGTLVVMLAAAVPMMLGYRPKLFGWILFVAYFEWMVIANSYGKVDHASFGFMTLLLVLCLMPSHAKWGDRVHLSERAGWGFKLVQIAVVLTYFLSAWAKFRYGGFDWANSGVFTWAIIRRGTVFSEWMLDFPWMLHAAQWGMIAFELLTPVVLFVYKWKRVQYAIVAFFYCFHVAVFVGIGISFLPHLVAMACFLPLERIDPKAIARRLKDRRRGGDATTREPEPQFEA